MQTAGSYSDQVDEDLYLGGQSGSILEGAIFSSAGSHECAIVTQNSIECWGSNRDGQLGNGQSYQQPSYSHSTVNLPSNTTTVHEITAADTWAGSYNCAIVDNGSVICWGTYDYYNTYLDWNHYSPVYVELPPNRSAVAIDNYAAGVVVIADDGMTYCLVTMFICNYGISSGTSNNYGEVVALGGGGELNCIALANLTIYCQGRAEPIPGGGFSMTEYWIDTNPSFSWVPNQRNLSFSMSVGSNHVCWIQISGQGDPIPTPRCFGIFENSNGYNNAHPSHDLLGTISISSGADHACVLIFNGSIYCWGYNAWGQLGQGSTGSAYYGYPLHVPMPDGKLATAIYSYGDSSCAATVDGSLYCWGEVIGTLHTSPTLVSLSAPLQFLDRDADDDRVLNALDLCSEGESNWQSTNSTDFDHDGCRDSTEDFDDDNDGVLDNHDSCPTSGANMSWGDIDWGPPATADTDNDGGHNTEDSDDDNDGFLDADDIFPFDSEEWADNDGDGGDECWELSAYCGGDNRDMDDDNDGWSDAWEYVCLTDPLSSDSIPIDTDEDSLWPWKAEANSSLVDLYMNSGPYLWCDFLDIDDDGDNVIDAEDAFPLNKYEWLDTDGDGIGNNGDYDDDGDGYNDTSDAFPLNASEWLDTDSDGIGNNADTDDDDDGYTDNKEIDCGTDSLDTNNTPPDFDEDSICDLLDPDDDDDGRLDEDDAFPTDPEEQDDSDSDGIGDNEDSDDDGDHVEDVDDFCSPGETNWISGAALGTDLDGDGCRDDGEDADDDGDGVEDGDDGCPRGHTGWTSNPANDIDGDGCHETEDYDRDGDGFSDTEDSFPEDPTEWYDSDGDGIGDNEDAYPNDSARWEFNDDDEGALDNESTILMLLGAILVLLIVAVVIVLRRK